jgi:hypothetical protein
MANRIDKQGLRVLIATPWNRIEGDHHLVPGLRVSDSVNSDIAAKARYLPLTNAVVRHGETGEVLFRSRFLMVAHAHIVCMAPVAEMEADERAPGSSLSGRQAAALAADMATLLRG